MLSGKKVMERFRGIKKLWYICIVLFIDILKNLLVKNKYNLINKYIQ